LNFCAPQESPDGESPEELADLYVEAKRRQLTKQAENDIINLSA